MENNKKYDAMEVASYIEKIDDANVDYKDKQAAVFGCFARYINNDTYLGRAAEASKLFIAECETKLLEETVSLHTEIRNAYLHAYDSFADKVDSSRKARISLEVLDKIAGDYRQLYADMDENGLLIEAKIAELRSKYGKYGYITQSNYDGARENFREFCGGEDLSTGFLADCSKKFIDYDAEESAYIDDTGIYERILENTERIKRISNVLDMADVNAYELEKQTININRVFSYDTGRFEYKHDELPNEYLVVLKRIHTNLDIINKSFNERATKDEEHEYVNSYRAGVNILSIWGQRIDTYLCNKIDGLFDSATGQQWTVINDGSLYGITSLIGSIQSIIKYGDFSHTKDFSTENTNAFYKGALKKLTHITTGIFSLPKLVEDMGDLGFYYILGMGQYLVNHDPKDIPSDLDNYLRNEIETGNAQIRCSVKELEHKIATMNVKEWFEVSGSASVDVALLTIGGELDKKGPVDSIDVDDATKIKSIGNYADDVQEINSASPAVKAIDQDVIPESRVEKYLEDIVDKNGHVNADKMRDVRLVIQKGEFSAGEISEISKDMAEKGITAEFEQEMRKINFGKYLTNMEGPPPEKMVDPHAHHILFKTGNGTAQKELVKEGQAILREVGIDPIVGIENIVWAPNAIEGQHNYAALEKVVNGLIERYEYGADYDDIVKFLNAMGNIASGK